MFFLQNDLDFWIASVTIPVFVKRILSDVSLIMSRISLFLESEEKINKFELNKKFEKQCKMTDSL